MERHNKALASLIPSKNANTTEGLLPSNEDTTSSKESGTPAGDTFSTIKPSLKNFLEEQSTSIDSAVDDREENMGQLELYRTHLAKWKQQHHQQMEKMKQLETLNKTISNDLEQEDCRVNNLIGKGREIVEQLKATKRRIQDITKEEELVQVINQACHCMDEDKDWKKKYQELFPDVKTVTTSKKIRDVTKKALMMVDDEAGATEQTNQLSDFTLPLMDKVQILLKYINFEELKQMKPDIRKKVEAGEVFGIQENQNDNNYSRLSLDNGRLLLHCLQNQPPPHVAFSLPVSEIIMTLNPESTITFLEMAWEGVTRGRVYIRGTSRNSGYFQKLRVLPETQGTSRNSGYFQKLRVLPETQGTSRNSGYFQKREKLLLIILSKVLPPFVLPPHPQHQLPCPILVHPVHFYLTSPASHSTPFPPVLNYSTINELF
ncbi:hypothetical protein Pmani_001915 [Petrolisthes manimaculis]|uniref:Uncharacterized protein n=1 Tax=Petrolisthes manimaculis TaxID=1843537 RepID=A0AAE1QJL7_9EUCA|nr:hypothetical protein Pmani_001915 [Petrolisthes manimaculis]